MTDSLLDRLAGCRDRIADQRKALRAEMDRRDSLICEAIDRGERYWAVSKASGRSIGTVAAIVSRGDPLAAERAEREAGVIVSAN